MRYIAFLGSINVGGRRVKMDRLRELFESMGYRGVSTFIASGNVLFEGRIRDSGAAEAAIEGCLLDALGYEVHTFMRTPAEVAAAVGHRPFPVADLEDAANTLHVWFLRRAFDATEERLLLSYRTARDDFHVRGRELFWLCRGKTADSLVKWPVLKKKLPIPATARNITMLRKLLSSTA